MKPPVMLESRRQTFRIVYVSKSISQGADNVSVNANDNMPVGYSFFCWVSAATVGWAGAPYFEFSDQPSTKIFSGIPCQFSNCSMNGFYLAVKYD